MNDFQDQELSDSLAAADSPSWSARAAAGRRLAAVPRIGVVADVLHRLLLDVQDTAVTSETAEALLARGDLAGLRAVLAARADATDQWTADQLVAELNGDPRWMTGDGAAELIRQLRVLAADTDPGVRNEARQRLSLLRQDD
ncbi:hypothetical protein [Kitasatospora sp. NPDC057223]|uniref:hypothetical protein n=1 Tax=Kitasatospora sp. NPDC057223 TaxID=3346055 RepID=UPI00363DEFD4